MIAVGAVATVDTTWKQVKVLYAYKPYGPYLPLGGIHVRGSLPRTSSQPLHNVHAYRQKSGPDAAACAPLRTPSFPIHSKHPLPLLAPPTITTLTLRSFICTKNFRAVVDEYYSRAQSLFKCSYILPYP